MEPKQKPLIITCETCGCSFTRRASQVRHTAKRGLIGMYCSHACSGASCSIQLPVSIIAEYESGASLSAIGKLHGVSWCTIRRFLMARGVQLRTKYAHIIENPPFKGKELSHETKSKQREASKKQFSTVEARQAAAERTIKQIQDGRTGKAYNKLEQNVAAQFQEQGITFIQQYQVGYHVFDFYLPETNTLVEVHGTYWHADPRIYADKVLTDSQKKNTINDKRKLTCAKNKGYNLKVIWEKDVRG